MKLGIADAVCRDASDAQFASCDILFLCDWGMENRPGTESKDNKQKERENK